MTPTQSRLLGLLLAGALGFSGCGPGGSSAPLPRPSERPKTGGPELGPPPTEVALARALAEPQKQDEPPAKKPMPPDPFLLPGQPPDDRDPKEPPPEKDPPIGKTLVPLIKDQPVLFFEKAADGTRRVHILAEVCLRPGALLEVLLCKAMTKEHESILHADVDARLIHAALEAAGARAGAPAQFFDEKTDKEEYKPASGTTIKITLTYYKDGKLHTEPARHWVRDVQTRKEMAHDWVFAGSRLYTRDEPDAKPYYCANNGDVISIANSVESMLDLPIKSSDKNAELAFEPYRGRIPPLRTKVLVTLEPVVPKKDNK